MGVDVEFLNYLIVTLIQLIFRVFLFIVCLLFFLLFSLDAAVVPQLISPVIRLKSGESSDSGFCSSPALTTQVLLLLLFIIYLLFN